MGTHLDRELDSVKANEGRVGIIFAALMLTMLMSSLGQMVFSTALPTIVGELGGVEHMSWVITAMMLTMTIAMPVAGKLGDQLGRKWLYVGGIGLFTLGSVIGGFADSMTALIFGRAVQGFGGGFMMINSQAIIAEIIPARRRGKYMGFIGAVFGVSSILGPVLGGWFTSGPGWRWGFWMNIPLGLLAMTVSGLVLKLRTGDPSKFRFDWLGTLIMAITTTSLVLLTTWAGTQYAWTDPVIIGLGIATLVGAVAFVAVELRVADPLIPPRLFRNRNMALTTVAGVVLGLAMMGALAYLPTYLQMVHGLTPMMSGLLMIPMMVGMMVTSTVVGIIITHTGEYKKYPIVGMGVVTIALVLMGLLTPDTPRWALGLLFFGFGFGLGLVMQVLVLIVQNSFPVAVVGTATAANNFFRQIGSTLGSSLVGGLFAYNLAHQMEANVPSAVATMGEEGDVWAAQFEGVTSLADNLTPALLHQLPEVLRDAIVISYNDALTPIYLLLAPLVFLAMLLLVPIRQDKLKDKVE